MQNNSVELFATSCFALAVLHTFASSRLHRLGNLFPGGTAKENFFHFLGEVEVIFGLWAAIFLAGFIFIAGSTQAISYAENQNFTEPLFVFVIMAVAATSPLLKLANRLVLSISRVLPLKSEAAFYLSCLTVGPLLGSFITEPAAMTVTALLLKQRFYSKQPSEFFKYATIAILFVNISIGGVLTPFAAPPVLMVAAKWNWDLGFMLSTFGWRAVIAVILNAVATAFVLRAELNNFETETTRDSGQAPTWVTLVHLLFLAVIVMFAHHAVIFVGLFLFFLGFVSITEEHQESLRLKESLLVAFFLGGLVVLGGMQKWWLDPILRGMSEAEIYFSATALTAFTDNAAITFLGSQIEGLSESFKYHLVAGAVVGGGLTVIANAPNPAGFSILQTSFGDGGIKPVKLLLFALPPTFLALILFWL